MAGAKALGIHIGVDLKHYVSLEAGQEHYIKVQLER